MFFKEVKKIYVVLYFLKERINKMEVEMDSENESQLKRIKKSPLLLNQKESVTEKVKKKILVCLTKVSFNVQKCDIFQYVFLIQNLEFFHVLTIESQSS